MIDLNKTCLILSLALISGSLASSAHAEQGCPQGFTPNAAGTPGIQCIPIGGQTHGVAGGGSATVPNWQTRWGSIAVDNASGMTGIQGNMLSRRKAERSALAHCREKGGANCEVKITYYNQCGVLAWGDGMMSTASAPTRKEAAGLAIAEYERAAGAQCQVFFSDCSYAEQI